jgi:hypothetical protein
MFSLMFCVWIGRSRPGSGQIITVRIRIQEAQNSSGFYGSGYEHLFLARSWGDDSGYLDNIPYSVLQLAQRSQRPRLQIGLRQITELSEVVLHSLVNDGPLRPARHRRLRLSAAAVKRQM